MSISPDKTLISCAIPTELLEQLDARIARLDSGAVTQASRGHGTRRSAVISMAISWWLDGQENETPSKAVVAKKTKNLAAKNGRNANNRRGPRCEP